MGPGFKYHVATIAAIFFALTVGLVIGSLFVSPQIAEGQKRAINALRESLRQEVSAQRGQIGVQQDQIDRYKKSISQLTPSLLRGKLRGMNVLLLQTGDYPDTVSSVRDALKVADAEVTLVAQTKQGFNRPDDVLKETLTRLHEQDSRLPQDREALGRFLVSLLLKGETPPAALLELLDSGEILHVEDDSLFLPSPRLAVLVAGSRGEDGSRVTYVDQSLIAALKKRGLTIVVVEPEDALFSDMPAYRTQKMDVATVDNVDSDLGRCALVLALRGDKADYGVKPTANRVLPPSVLKQN